MAIFRIERTKDYTVMSNYHLRDSSLSLKSKGLLSMMLSLPDEWNYSIRGLASICKEGVDAIGSALRELEKTGYIVRNQLRDSNGRIKDTEYIIYEQAKKPNISESSPCTENPDMVAVSESPSEADCISQPCSASPDADFPDVVTPHMKNHAQLNIDKSNIEKSSKEESYPIRESAMAAPSEENGASVISAQQAIHYRYQILSNLDYGYLQKRYPSKLLQINELVELIVETVCANRQTTRIASSDLPHSLVRERFRQLTSSHIDFVMENLSKSTADVRNIKQYLLTVLFNSVSTMDNAISAQVNHAMGQL